MFVINDVAYASEYNNENLKIKDFKIIAELYMLVTFSNGEKRIFDVTKLVKYPIYEKLHDFEVFKQAHIENGILVWDNGKIDIATETVYKNSYIYEQEIAI